MIEQAYKRGESQQARHETKGCKKRVGNEIVATKSRPERQHPAQHHVHTCCDMLLLELLDSCIRCLKPLPWNVEIKHQEFHFTTASSVMSLTSLASASQRNEKQLRGREVFKQREGAAMTASVSGRTPLSCLGTSGVRDGDAGSGQ